MKRRSFLWSMLAAPVVVQARSLLPAMQAIPELPVAPMAAMPARRVGRLMTQSDFAAVCLPILTEGFDKSYKDMK